MNGSTWGASWGACWGDTWGTIDTSLPGGGGSRIRAPKPVDERLRRLADDEAMLLLIIASIATSIMR